MHLHRDEPLAAARARWMAELAAAIDGAQRVAWELGSSRTSQAARDLYQQLEAARQELEALRGVTSRIREELDPWLPREDGASESEKQPD